MAGAWPRIAEAQAEPNEFWLSGKIAARMIRDAVIISLFALVHKKCDHYLKSIYEGQQLDLAMVSLLEFVKWSTVFAIAVVVLYEAFVLCVDLLVSAKEHAKKLRNK